LATSSNDPSAPAGGTDYAPPKKMGMLVVVVVALLLVTNVATGLAVYYLAPATPAPTVQPLRVIGPWSGSEKDKFLPVLNLFKNTTGINYEYITTAKRTCSPSCRTGLPPDGRPRTSSSCRARS